MWLWLQNNNKSNLKTFFKKIFIVSLLVHLIFLIICFFGFKGKVLNLDIFLNKDLLNNPPVPVIFLPFAKNIPGSVEQLKKLSKKSRMSKKSKKTFVKKSIVLKKNKITKKPILISKPKNNKKIEPKKTEIIKNNLKEMEKIIPQNEEPKLSEQEIKKVEPLKPDIKKIEPNEIVNELNLDEPVTIYLGAKDMQGYQLVFNIQREILKYWKPPMGLPKGIECKVNIKVDKEGKVENLKIEKSSKVLAYDISLRNAILKSVMPHEVKGREFTLTLNC